MSNQQNQQQTPGYGFQQYDQQFGQNQFNSNNNYGNFGDQNNQQFAAGYPAQNQQFGYQNQNQNDMMMPNYNQNNMMMPNQNMGMQQNMMQNQNMGMMQPGMPQQNMMIQNMAMMQMGMMPMNMQQDQSMYLLTQDMHTRLQSATQFKIQATRRAGCDNMVCMRQLPTKVEVTFGQFSPNPAYEFELNDIPCCAFNIGGKVLGKVYDQTGNVVQQEQMYKYNLSRPCCIFQALFGWLHVFGMCIFYLFTICFRGSLTLYNGNQKVSSATPGCCLTSTDIYMDDKLKFTAKRGQNILGFDICDANGMPLKNSKGMITGFQRKGQGITSVTILLPQDLSPEEKMSIIFGMSRLV